jgi:hypothetical protein
MNNPSRNHSWKTVKSGNSYKSMEDCQNTQITSLAIRESELFCNKENIK